MDNKEYDPIEKHLRATAARDLLSSMVKTKVNFDGQRIFAYMAQTQAQQMVGLEIAESLEPKEGMLFPFSPIKHVTFHMGSVEFPIDIIFLQKDFDGLKVATIAHNVHPGSEDRWSCDDTAAVLEVAGGTCKQLGIKVGSVCSTKISVSLSNQGV